MSLVLRSLVDGQRWSFVDGRLLFGRGRPADVILPPGREHIVAMLVHYPQGWILHDLCSDNVIQVNGEPIKRRSFVQPGDKLHLAGADFTLELESSGKDPGESLEDSTMIRDGTVSGVDATPLKHRWLNVLVHMPNGDLVHRRVRDELLVGRSKRCDLPFPEANGLARRHMLLARVEGQWYFHDLSGTGIRRNDGRKSARLLLKDSVSGKLGRDLLVTFEIGDELPDGEPELPAPKSTQQVPTRSSLETPSIPMLAAPAELVLAPTDPFRAEAMSLCRWLAQTHHGPVHNISAHRKLMILVKIWRARRQSDPRQTLAVLSDCLKQAPFDRETMLAFARFLESRDELDLCRDVLTLMLVQYPQDAIVKAALDRLTEYLSPV